MTKSLKNKSSIEPPPLLPHHPHPKKQKKTTTTPPQEDGIIRNSTNNNSVAIAQAFAHYRNFLGYNNRENEEEDDDEYDDTNNDGSGETDQLKELLEILEPIPLLFPDDDNSGPINRTPDTTNSNEPLRIRLPPLRSSSSSSSSTTSSKIRSTERSSSSCAVASWHSLVPLLKSVASGILADEAIASLVLVQNSNQHQPEAMRSPGVKNNNDKSENEKDDGALEEIRHHLHNALMWFPANATALVTAINFLRMTKATISSNGRSSSTAAATASLSTASLSKCYAVAADIAKLVRASVLEQTTMHTNSNHDTNKDNDDEEEDIQEMALLLLNHTAGLEWVPTDDMGDSESEEEEEDDEDPPFVLSPSAVEGTARFMAAMLYSMAGQHSPAKEQLRHFDGLTHRLHPHLWEFQKTTNVPTATTTTMDPGKDSTPKSPSPVSFQSTTDGGGVLPLQLYQRLCHVFHPDAPYWKESNYAGRGYYSFYSNVQDSPPPPRSSLDANAAADAKPKRRVTNAMEDVVENHLLPLAKAYLAQQQQHQQTLDTAADISIQTATSTACNEIVGYEWWVHTRSVAANLGHNLHFDTDEELLMRDGSVKHPVLSSVLYLTGGLGGGDKKDNSSSRGGATVVFDQRPDSITNARQAWCSLPIDNSFMIFPGNLLHGVLPCLGSTAEGSVPTSTDKTDHDEDDILHLNPNHVVPTLTRLLSAETTQRRQQTTDNTPHRLTLMIGFWTRRIPDGMAQEPELYGPCSPLPPEGETEWVQALRAGYNNINSENSGRTVDDSLPQQKHWDPLNSTVIVPMPLPSFSPAWEELKWNDCNNNNGQSASTLRESEDPQAAYVTVLTVPREIDHRFFVSNAPECFRTSLLEKREQHSDDFVDDDFDGEDDRDED